MNPVFVKVTSILCSITSHLIRWETSSLPISLSIDGMILNNPGGLLFYYLQNNSPLINITELMWLGWGLDISSISSATSAIVKTHKSNWIRWVLKIRLLIYYYNEWRLNLFVHLTVVEVKNWPFRNSGKFQYRPTRYRHRHREHCMDGIASRRNRKLVGWSVSDRAITINRSNYSHLHHPVYF